MRRLTSLLVAVVALSIVAPAQGQIPNPLRKAKEKAQQAVTTPASTQSGPKFDNTMLELTPQLVARMIKGLDVSSRVTGRGGMNTKQLRQRAQSAYDEATKINNEHGDERNEYYNKKGEADNCVGMKLQELNNEHYQELQRKMMGMVGVNTPEKMAFMQEFAALSQEASQAAMSQDTAAMRRVSARQNKLLGVDPKADSAKARATCNVPVPPRWLTLADSLTAQSDTLHNETRELEVRSMAAAARAAELTPDQYAMALERIVGFVASSGHVGAYAYSVAEKDALTAQLTVLRRYLG